MANSINLGDYVEFMYLEDLVDSGEMNTIQEVQTVKDIIDDWYGECHILPSNDTSIMSAVINHKNSICDMKEEKITPNETKVDYTVTKHQTNILDKIGGEKADIESLMEFLVKETGYKTAC